MNVSKDVSMDNGVVTSFHVIKIIHWDIVNSSITLEVNSYLNEKTFKNKNEAVSVKYIPFNDDEYNRVNTINQNVINASQGAITEEDTDKLPFSNPETYKCDYDGTTNLMKWAYNKLISTNGFSGGTISE